MKKIVILLTVFILLMPTVFAESVLEMEKPVDITSSLILGGSATLTEENGEKVIKLTGEDPVNTWGTATYEGDLPKNFSLSFEYKLHTNSEDKPNGKGILLSFFSNKLGDLEGDPILFQNSGGEAFWLDADCYDRDRTTCYVTKLNPRTGKYDVSQSNRDMRCDYIEWHTVDLVVNGQFIGFYVDGYAYYNYSSSAMLKNGNMLYLAAMNGEEGMSEEIVIRNVLFEKGEPISASAPWATPELLEAAELGLIPDMLWGADMRRPITRLQFAALSVELYEAVSGKTADAVETPFTDAFHPAVAKAYGLGITGGVSENKFAPDDIISREQVATMLTRALKAAIPNLNTKVTGIKKFADDAKISDWARESVYFMASRGIINGIGDNKFAPKNTTPAEVAAGYASSTIEQAVIIAKRALSAS